MLNTKFFTLNTYLLYTAITVVQLVHGVHPNTNRRVFHPTLHIISSPVRRSSPREKRQRERERKRKREREREREREMEREKEREREGERERKRDVPTPSAPLLKKGREAFSLIKGENTFSLIKRGLLSHHILVLFNKGRPSLAYHILFCVRNGGLLSPIKS